jgi:hypothetical protein
MNLTKFLMTLPILFLTTILLILLTTNISIFLTAYVFSLVLLFSSLLPSFPYSEYMTQADPSHSTSKVTSRIAQKQFFDLCTCRQLTVRRLLEAFAVSQVDWIQYNTVLIYTAYGFTALHCTALHCFIDLYCTYNSGLCYNMLHYAALYCTITGHSAIYRCNQIPLNTHRMIPIKTFLSLRKFLLSFILFSL